MKADYENAIASSREITSHPRNRKQVASNPFAGRVGGNQEFIDDAKDDGEQPDAAPLSSLRGVIAPESFVSPNLWRMACLEGLGSFLVNFMLGALASGLSSSTISLPVQVVIASVTGWFTLSLLIYCLGPVSGAHITPTITMATFFTGLTTLPRAVLYMSAQCIGAIAAAYWLKLGLGSSFFATGVIPGCTVIEDLVQPGQMFALEFGFCLAEIFLAFGLGLDPRQAKTLGPTYAPVLIGLTLALGNTASGFAKPGYTGMSFNPARCLGLMTASGNLQYHYVHWLAPFAATILNGIVYRVVPPWEDNTSILSRFRAR